MSKTILQAVREQNPNLETRYLLVFECPSFYGYKNGCDDTNDIKEICNQCWNRPAAENKIE